MSARDYLMKTVMSVYNVSARWTVKTDKFTLFVYILQFSCLTKYNRMQSKHKQTNCKQQTKILRITAFSEGITILNQRIFKKTISNSSLNSHFYWDTLYVNVISSDPPLLECRVQFPSDPPLLECRVQFTSVPLKALSRQVWIRYSGFVFQNWLFLVVVSIQKWLTHFLLQKP